MVRSRRCKCWLLCGAALAAVAGTASSADPPRGEDWSTKPPPPGWSKDAYAPDRHAPAFGEGLDPNQYGPKGSYDAYFDPYHPLKNPDEDPGAKWDQPGSDSSPGINNSSGDWKWGERYFDSEFSASLEITNNCKSPRPVRIYVNDLPYLTLAEQITAPPGKSKIEGRIKLPPEPPPPIRLGLPGEPGWGHVQFPPFIPVGFPPPKLHQPNFIPIVGTVVAWHAWAASDTDCLPKRTTWTVSGHIHFRPPSPPAPDSGPERIAGPGVCQVYWNIGVPPANYQGEDCTAEMRRLAIDFRDRVLPPYVLNAPEEWLWLPSTAGLESYDVPQLLEVKAHASALMSGS